MEYAGCDPVRVSSGDTRPDGRACEIWGTSIIDGARRPGTLTLWVKASEGARLVVAADGRWLPPLPSSGREQEGARLDVDVDKGVREVTVTAKLGSKSRVFRLPIVTAEGTEDLFSLKEAIALRKGRRPPEMTDAEAQNKLDKEIGRLMGSPSPAIRAKATGQRARVLTQRGKVEEAILTFRQAMAGDHEVGLVADEVADGIAFARLLLEGPREIEEAGLVLTRVERLAEESDFPAGRAMIPHYRAVIAEALGDLGSARRLENESEERSRRLALEGHLADVYQRQIKLLDMLGRHDEAKAYVDTKLKKPDEANACALGQYYNNMGWHRLLTGGAERVAAKLDFEEARRLFSSSPEPGGRTCTSARELRNVLTNLAHLALEQEQPEEAERRLEEAHRAYPDAPVRLTAEWNVMSARAALARRDYVRAEGLFRTARTLSKAAALPSDAVNATLGLAEALERIGSTEEALLAYHEADEELNRWSMLIPLGEGKQTFFGERERGVRRYLELLSTRADAARREGGSSERWVRQMACVARRSLTRALASMEWAYRLARTPAEHAELARAARDQERRRKALSEEANRALLITDPAEQAQRLAELITMAAQDETAFDAKVARVAGPRPAPSCEEGAPGGQPEDDEIVLVYHPLEAGWAGLALTRSTAVLHRFAFADEGAIAPLDHERRRALRDKLGDALLGPFAGVLGEGKKKIRILAAEPLGSIDIHELPIPGGATLGSRFSVTYGVDLPRPPAPASSERRALLVAVPTRNLSMPARETGYVREALKRAGWSVRELVGPDATRAAVRRELEQPGVELFHYAGHGVSRGRDGWESHLVLDGGEWISIADVLGLARAPRLVVLSSCQAAAAKGNASVEGPNLAHAFLIAGTERMVASPLRNDDATTTAVMKELYDRHLPALLDDPPAALRVTFEALEAREDLKGISSFPHLRVLAR
ncbi:MAG: CHAT domain-containing protein [Minicystis sp.]